MINFYIKVLYNNLISFNHSLINILLLALFTLFDLELNDELLLWNGELGCLIEGSRMVGWKS